MKALSYTAILLAAFACLATPAQAETRIDIVKPITVSSAAPNYTVQAYKGLFGETQTKAISPQGNAYVVPGSSMERSRSYARNGFPDAGTCPDGKPRRYEYHFPGGTTCAADRPQ